MTFHDALQRLALAEDPVSALVEEFGYDPLTAQLILDGQYREHEGPFARRPQGEVIIPKRLRKTKRRSFASAT